MEIEMIQKQILKDFNKKTVELNAHFSEAYESFFNDYQDEIQSLKKKLISEQPVTNTPKEIWSTINDHLDDLRKRIAHTTGKTKFGIGPSVLAGMEGKISLDS